MNHVAKFQRIWEFRKKDHDGDSLGDSEANPGLEPYSKKPQSGIILLDNNEVSNTLAHTSDGVETVAKKRPSELDKKKRKENWKEIVVKDKTKRYCSVKKHNKGNRPMKLDDIEEAGMFNDLKNYANSLIDELKVARENMFAKMKEERTKIMAVKPAKCPEGLTGKRTRSNKVNKNDQVPEFKMTTEKPFESKRGKLMKSYMNTVKDGNQPVPWHYSTLPTVVPKPHSQSHRKIVHLDGCAPDNSVEPLMKQTSPGYDYYNGVPVMHSGQIRGFTHMSSKPLGFSDQHYSRMTSESVGFKVPTNQALGSGLVDCSNLSSQTYFDNAVQDNNGLRISMPRFRDDGSGSSSGGIQPNCITNDDDQKITAFWSQEMERQFYPGFKN